MYGFYFETFFFPKHIEMHENRKKGLKTKRIMKTMHETQIKEKADFTSNDLTTKLEGMNDETDLKTAECTDFSRTEEIRKSGKLSPNTLAYSCKLCASNHLSTMFSKKSQLRIHERRCHPKETIRIPSELKSTELTAKQANVSCEQCSYECISKSALEKHILAVHRKERPHPCPECGKRFTQTSHVNYHLKTVHAQPGALPRTKSHICNECGAKFATSSTLRKHQRTHTGIFNTRFPKRLCK